jgi:4-alpha-glucanotransferase
VLHAQHRTFRELARGHGLELWGDLAIGLSGRDEWRWQHVMLDGYRLGAPPSRTNPEGQPWGYPVLDPGRPRGRRAFVRARLEKLFAEYDGVRIDHPHGHVCPWVYRAGTGDDGIAVRSGARLFSSPDLPDHPALARLAIAARRDLNPRAGTPRHADDWVVALDGAQVARYAEVVDLMVAAARTHGRSARALACEVLSTCPYPLARVLARHGLGRFRVTQKADLRDPADVCRSENADPADWVMVGTHDTMPLWALLDDWERSGVIRDRAAYLAWRLAPDPAGREAMARDLTSSPARLGQAQFADLFASRARHVQVFFTDALGHRTPYNRPGTVDATNWSLRLPADHAERLVARLGRDAALNLPLALAWALRARAKTGGDHAALVARLEAEAAAWRSRGPQGE